MAAETRGRAAKRVGAPPALVWAIAFSLKKYTRTSHAMQTKRLARVTDRRVVECASTRGSRPPGDTRRRSAGKADDGTDTRVALD